MSKRRYLDDPPEVDAITGPDRKNTYAYLYQDYINNLRYLKNSSSKENEARKNEDNARQKFANKAKELYGDKYYVLTDGQRRRLYTLVPEYLQTQIEREEAYEDFNNKKNNYFNSARRLGQATINKYRGTNFDVLAADNWGGENYLASLGVRESRGANEVANYFNSYADSPGFDRIINNQKKNVTWYKRVNYVSDAKRLRKSIKDNPLSNIGVFDVDRFAEGGKNIYKGSAVSGTGKSLHVIINKDDPFVKDDYQYWFTVPHEMMHDYNYTHGGQAEGLNKNQNTAPGHDSRLNEKHSDLEALRFMLYKYGIYDSRGTKDATPEDIQKLRNKYPDIRPLKQMDNEKAAWMLNNVAQNNTKKRKHLDEYYA